MKAALCPLLCGSITMLLYSSRRCSWVWHCWLMVSVPTGIDSEGHAANFVESEQIVLYEGAKASFVQVSLRVHHIIDVLLFALRIIYGLRCVSPASHSVLPPVVAGAESRPLRPWWGPAEENAWMVFHSCFFFLWNNQTRGSMPFYWSQRPNLRYKPKPIISKTTNHVSWSFCTSARSFQSCEMEILC